MAQLAPEFGTVMLNTTQEDAMPANETKKAPKTSTAKSRSPAQARSSALPVAKVALIVGKDDFRNVLVAGESTVATMKTVFTPGQVTAEEQVDRVWVRDQVLHIRRPGAQLLFKVKSRKKGEILIPLGIAFWRLRGSRKDRAALVNFKDATILRKGSCLYATDSFKDTGKPDKYKFSIMIQRLNDGAIGIIDPPIEHEDEI